MPRIIVLGEERNGEVFSILGSDSYFYLDGRYGKERMKREIQEQARKIRHAPTHWGYVESLLDEPVKWWPIWQS